MVSGKLGGKTCLFANPTLRHTIRLSWENVYLNLLSGSRRHTSLEVERRADDLFSVSNPATRPTRH